jgi:hypothetical protein
MPEMVALLMLPTGRLVEAFAPRKVLLVGKAGTHGQLSKPFSSAGPG